MISIDERRGVIAKEADIVGRSDDGPGHGLVGDADREGRARPFRHNGIRRFIISPGLDHAGDDGETVRRRNGTDEDGQESSYPTEQGWGFHI